MSERAIEAADIERVIRSLCYAQIRSVEGRTIDTTAIAALEVHGIELAAKEIAALAAQRAEKKRTPRSHINKCPCCYRTFKDGETWCVMGGCPMGGDI